MTSPRSIARRAGFGFGKAPKTGLAATVGSHPYLSGAVAGAVVLALTTFVNFRLAAAAERRNPPTGNFVEVDGVRLHYIEEGVGEPLVLLHGNGSMIQDFASSGLINMASKRYRVIAFDRPGFGHSKRPRSRIWTAEAQAELIEAALGKIGVSKAIVLGHSWGCSVAVALALKSPSLVAGLVLASGYYFPTVRADVVTMSGPAIPVFGDAIRYTLSPLLARLMWPLLTRKIFGPGPVPEKFEVGFPKEMTFRPSQIRASSAESALMVPGAFAARNHYAELKMPVAIVAGEEDRLINIDEQSARLHSELPNSTMHPVPGAGHMVHQTAPTAVMAAIEVAASAGALRHGR
ncbi:alpha/beta fold hydrolase [Mesorhizobium wenxiniae]|uniref:Alpha/beta hydrolase n=1 Tax=Mesorhizobium wenxiniae TaxID=2014805 RepID=A0A271KJL5_9HYPH|nr:alpha/beta hydrolase [Mesorhizobium wenxiniae]PAP95614.1 alpha/beta hydrolase [Mesorhizobium wenxiniae]